MHWPEIPDRRKSTVVLPLIKANSRTLAVCLSVDDRLTACPVHHVTDQTSIPEKVI